MAHLASDISMGQKECKTAGDGEVVDESVLPANDPDHVWSKVQNSQVFQPIVTSAVLDRKPDSVRFVTVSDTHGKHRNVQVPPGDVFIHAGDFTNVGEPEQVQDFHDWVAEQPHPFKIVIAGNHDLTMDAPFFLNGGSRRLHRDNVDPHEVRSCLVSSETVVYLEDSVFEIPVESITANTAHAGRKMKVWGSPHQPEFGNWAFNLPRGAATRAKAKEVPTETDILLTHGPPLGRGDLCIHGGRAGCIDMLSEVQTRIKPLVHIFGHIHEGYGASYDGNTTYVNASTCTLQYRPTQPPIVFDVGILPDGSMSTPTFIGDVRSPGM